MHQDKGKFHIAEIGYKLIKINGTFRIKRMFSETVKILISKKI